MTKDFDDTNWKQEILGSLEFNQTKFASKLLKNGAKSFMQSIYLGYLYTRWKKLKDIREQSSPNWRSSFQEWNKKVEDVDKYQSW